MSEHVTWVACLRCGHLAAVGWVCVLRIDRATPENRPVEFDCTSGCQVGLDDVAQVYGLPGASHPRRVRRGAGERAGGTDTRTRRHPAPGRVG